MPDYESPEDSEDENPEEEEDEEAFPEDETDDFEEPSDDEDEEETIFIATAPRELAFPMRIIQAVFAVAIFFFVGVYISDPP